jgi:muramoyltetrapeptide carboxypeptidase
MKEKRFTISYLENLGHTVLTSAGTFAVNGYKSSSAQQRAAELSKFLRDPQIDLIMATTGGYNSNEILEFLDLSSLKNSQKIFIGYSDCTALSLALQQHNVCISVSGPMLVDFEDHPGCFEQLFSALKNPCRKLANEMEIWESAASGRFPMTPMRRLPFKSSSSTGWAFAANLSTLCLMIGTPYISNLSNCTLFLEYDREEQRALPSLERFLWQLRQVGILSQLSGLVFGALQASVAAEETEFDSIERILTEVTAGYSYPVVFNAHFGHIYPSWVIINGSKVQITESCIYTEVPDPD